MRQNVVWVVLGMGVLSAIDPGPARRGPADFFAAPAGAGEDPAMRLHLARMCLNRRRGERRQRRDEELISEHRAFDRAERSVFRSVDRRRQIRRDVDLRRAIAAIGE